MAAQVAAVRAVSRGAEETPSLPLGDRPGRPRGGGRKRKGPLGDAGSCKRAKLSQPPLTVRPSQAAEPLPPASVPGLPATPAVPSAPAGLFTFSPLSLPPQALHCERRHHHRHRHRPDSGDSEPGRSSGEKPHKGRRGSSGDGALGRPSKRGELERGAGTVRTWGGVLVCLSPHPAPSPARMLLVSLGERAPRSAPQTSLVSDPLLTSAAREAHFKRPLSGFFDLT